MITKNEEDNIGDCLKSVHGWADEIIIVDDESTDRTVEIAKQYADQIGSENQRLHSALEKQEYIITEQAQRLAASEQDNSTLSRRFSTSFTVNPLF